MYKRMIYVSYHNWLRMEKQSFFRFSYFNCYVFVCYVLMFEFLPFSRKEPGVKTSGDIQQSVLKSLFIFYRQVLKQQ
jgi:hypothetical protein